MAAPKIKYDNLAPVSRELDVVRAERDRAQRDCERMGSALHALRAALLRITAIVETQTEPDIDAIHDVAREALSE